MNINAISDAGLSWMLPIEASGRSAHRSRLGRTTTIAATPSAGLIANTMPNRAQAPVARKTRPSCSPTDAATSTSVTATVADQTSPPPGSAPIRGARSPLRSAGAM